MSYARLLTKPESATASAKLAKSSERWPTHDTHVFLRNQAKHEAERIPRNPGVPHWSLSRVRIEAKPRSGEGMAAPDIRSAFRSAGRPLDPAARDLFKHGFTHDLGRVRIHTGEDAAATSHALHAAAFTVGNDIGFARNRYAPATPTGQLLLLHELRHVEQQRSAAVPQRIEVDTAASPQEQEASSLLSPSVSSVAMQRVQCAPEEKSTVHDTALDKVGALVFGKTGWCFFKALHEGFVSGIQAEAKSGRAAEVQAHLALALWPPWNLAKLYAGYGVGLVIGLVSPITDLVKGIIGAVRLSSTALIWLAKWSPPGVAVSPVRQKKIVRLMEKFGALETEFEKSLVQFLADPKGAIKKVSGFLDNLMELALAEARALGSSAAHKVFDYLLKPYYEMGLGIGRVAGEVIAQVLLLVFSDAIGNLVTKGAAFFGKAADFAAGKAVELFEWVKGFASAVLSKLRKTIKGGLKLFEGLTNKAIEAFEALKAIFTEAEALELGAQKIVAGVGKVEARALPEMESALEAQWRLTKGVHPEWFRRMRRRQPLPKKTRTESPLKSLGHIKPRPSKGYWTGKRPKIETALDFLESLSHPEKHHFWPRYLGGLKKQTLRKLTRSEHHLFHEALDKWNGGIFSRAKGAAFYSRMTSAQIIAELRAFYLKTFPEYIPDFARAIAETLSAMGKVVP